MTPPSGLHNCYIAGKSSSSVPSFYLSALAFTSPPSPSPLLPRSPVLPFIPAACSRLGPGGGRGGGAADTGGGAGGTGGGGLHPAGWRMRRGWGGQQSRQTRSCPFTGSFPTLLSPCAYRRKNTPNHPLPPSPQVMADASLTCYFEVDIVPYFRRVHAHVAATCATLADAIRHRARGGDQAVRAVGRGGVGRRAT